MKIERTGIFQGSWDEVCPHCGRRQLDHKVTYPVSDEHIIEHRMPCEIEQAKLRREGQIFARNAKALVFLGWVVLPFAILAIQFIDIVANIALLLAVLKLAFKGFEIYGNVPKWFPRYAQRQKEKGEKEALERHYIYHCSRNHEGFRRLVVENGKKAL